MLICKELGFIFPKGITTDILDELYKESKDSRVDGYTEDGQMYMFLNIVIKFGISNLYLKNDIERMIDSRENQEQRAKMWFFYKNHNKSDIDTQEFKRLCNKKFGVDFS